MHEQIADLTEQVAHYKRELGLLRDAEVETTFMRRWGLSASEAAVLALLHRRGGRIATIDLIMACLYPVDADIPSDQKIIDVFVCKTRKKMGAPGYILVARTHGYHLSPAGVAACDEVLTVGSC